MTLDTMSAEACYQHALALKKRGEVRKAAQLLQVAMLKDPKDPRYRRLRESLLGTKAGQAKVLAPPERAQKNAGRARAALALGKDEEAEDLLRHLIKDDPTDPDHPLALATILLRRDRSPEAIGLARRACQLGPDRLECHLLMEEVYRYFGPASAADSTRRQVRRLAPGGREALGIAEETLKGFYEAPMRLEIVPPRGQYRRFGLLVGLFSTTALLYGQFGPTGYQPMDIGPFAAELPVDAAALDTDVSQVILTLDSVYWEGLSPRERREALEVAQGLGQTLGYRSIRLEDEDEGNLGWSDGERIYLWAESGWGQGEAPERITAKAPGRDGAVEEGVEPAKSLEEVKPQDSEAQ